jgi:hypothetical protein
MAPRGIHCPFFVTSCCCWVVGLCRGLNDPEGNFAGVVLAMIEGLFILKLKLSVGDDD